VLSNILISQATELLSYSQRQDVLTITGNRLSLDERVEHDEGRVASFCLPVFHLEVPRQVVMPWGHANLPNAGQL